MPLARSKSPLHRKPARSRLVTAVLPFSALPVPGRGGGGGAERVGSQGGRRRQAVLR